MCRLSAQHEGHGLGRVDQSGQTERAAEAGMQTEIDLWKAELGTVDSDPVIAGKRDFEARSECRAMHHRNCRERELFQPVQSVMGPAEKVFGAVFRQVPETLDV